MEDKIKEFRCFKCNALFCKASINSIIEVKCRKCKLYSLYNKGITTLLGINNYFKGEK